MVLRIRGLILQLSIWNAQIIYQAGKLENVLQELANVINIILGMQKLYGLIIGDIV